MNNVNISPARGNLRGGKKTMGLTNMGYGLMDRKRNIPVREMMALVDKANSLRDRVDETYYKACATLQNANITPGLC